MTNTFLTSEEYLVQKIFLIRGHKVMIDNDLADLYQVDTKVLKQAVKRNLDIFPGHFMFELTREEFNNLRSQIVTSSWGGQRYLPMVFTEHGVLQVANVLRSKRARIMSIRIIEVFIKLRNMLLQNTELRLSVEQLERKTTENSQNIELLFKCLDQFMEKVESNEPRVAVGFKTS